MTRRELLAQVEGLLVDAKDRRERIALSYPDRLPTAQLMVDDMVRAYSLIESYPRYPKGRRELEINSRLARALVLSEALNADPQ